MAVLQENHIEEAFYNRNNKLFGIHFSRKDSKLSKSRASFLAKDKTKYITYKRSKSLKTNDSKFLDYNNKRSLVKNDSQKSYFTEADTKYFSYENIKFVENDNSKHLEKDNTDHLEKDNINHLEKDNEVHLVESDGETSDDNDEDFNHFINWNKMLAPFVFKVRKGTWKDQVTNKDINKKLIVMDRFEVFDLNTLELCRELCRYKAGYQMWEVNKLQIEYNKMINNIESQNNSVLQQQVLEYLKNWKHNKERELVDPDYSKFINKANYDVGNNWKKMTIDTRTAQQRKQDRLNYMKKKEEERKRDKLHRQRTQIEKVARNQEMLADMNHQAIQRKNYKDSNMNQHMSNYNIQLQNNRNTRKDIFNDMLDERKVNDFNRKDNIMNQRRMHDEKSKQEQNIRNIKNKKKIFVTELIQLFIQKSVGINISYVENEFYVRYNKEWTGYELFDCFSIHDLINADSLLKRELIILKGGWVIKTTNYNNLKIINGDISDIIDACERTDNINEAVKVLKAEKIRANMARESAPKSHRESLDNMGKYNDNWGLPPLWEVKKTKKGKLYFIDHSNQNTTWNDPRPLPKGYRKGKSKDGRVFFINDKQKRTQWNDPRPKILI